MLTSRTVRRVVTATAGGVLAGLTLLAQPATAGNGDGGGQTDSGFTVSVSVRYSGDAAPSGGGTISTPVPVKCYWKPWEGEGFWLYGPNVDPKDPSALLDELNEFTESALSRADVEQAVADAEAGLDPTLYEYVCHDLIDQIYAEGPNHAYFNANETVPPPLVDPEDLAETAFDQMDLQTPEVDRNPKANIGPGDSTLVNLPTWFWVTNPQSVGGDDGVRTIRAEITGTPVFAELTATTGGLTISSPAGGRTCSPELAQVAYAPGIADSQACSFTFTRASNGAGWPVSASTAWNATWVGQTQDGESVGGNLGATSRTSDFNVPVAEVQTLVRPR